MQRSMILSFYHSKKLQSTKTIPIAHIPKRLFYHSKKLQSTKTIDASGVITLGFYHSKKLQSTKTLTYVVYT